MHMAGPWEKNKTGLREWKYKEILRETERAKCTSGKSVRWSCIRNCSHGAFQKLQSFRMRENHSICRTTLHLPSHQAYFSNWMSRCRIDGSRTPKVNQPCRVRSMNKLTKSGDYFLEGAGLRADWMASEGQSSNLLPLFSKERASIQVGAFTVTGKAGRNIFILLLHCP